MKTAFVITGLLLSLIINLNSQVQQEWVSRFNDGYGYDIKLDNTGNIYVFGVGSETGANNDYLTIKYNSSGIAQWVSEFVSFRVHSWLYLTVPA